jgi:phosphoglycolate phosphatase
MQRPDAVLFDLDGTLVDSRVPFVRSMNAALAAHGQPTREPEQLYRYLGPPTHTSFAELLGGDGELVQTLVDTYRAEYRRIADEQTTVFDGVEELLRDLRGKVALAVATSKILAAAEPLIVSMGLRDLLDVVTGPAIDSVNETKAVTIGRALSLLGNPERAVMVGDRRFDVEGAAAHGLPTIGVVWGGDTESELRAAGVAAIADAPAEVASLLGF